MHLDLGIALVSVVVGVVVGLTGMGGGALMTPLLVLGFGVAPLTAVSSDLVAAVVMKPIGGGIHFRRGTVHTGLVLWLALGSIPGALIGSYAVAQLDGADDAVKTLLGSILLIAAGALLVRMYLSQRRAHGADGAAAQRVPVRRLATFTVGLVGGAVVGMTSVGSGSLMIVALMLLYPKLSSKELVGTDLVQATPLVLAAAFGHILWGEFQLGLTGSLLIGSVPGVILGAHISTRAPDHIVRPILVTVLALSALKLLDVSNTVLAVAVVIAATVGVTVGAITYRHRRAARDRPADGIATADPGAGIASTSSTNQQE